MDVAGQVGRNIQKIRKQQGFSQEALAFECDLHRTYISGLERGVRNPTVIAIDKIARALKVPAADLVEGLGYRRK
jgi:transcriptional regulator with XRE-family HTH domain